MLELGEKAYEDLRYEFVESRRLNKEHPMWKKLWNGVSPGMWDSEEWYDYLRSKGAEKYLEMYHPAALAGSLDEFFA
jgi:hypothetical protein